eukprot:9158330-Alexandrium_andersonii.AAC.1
MAIAALKAGIGPRVIFPRGRRALSSRRAGQAGRTHPNSHLNHPVEQPEHVPTPAPDVHLAPIPHAHI